MAGTDVLHAATMSPQVLQSGQVSTTADATIYTAGSTSSVRLTGGVYCNTTGSSVNVYLGVCKTGQTAGAANRIISAYPLGAGDSLSLTAYIGGLVLGPSDFITAYAGTASAANLVFWGVVSS